MSNNQQRIQDFQKTVCELHTENIQLRSRIHKVFERLQELHQERIDLRTANKNLMREIADLRAECSLLEDQKAELQNLASSSK